MRGSISVVLPNIRQNKRKTRSLNLGPFRLRGVAGVNSSLFTSLVLFGIKLERLYMAAIHTRKRQLKRVPGPSPIILHFSFPGPGIARSRRVNQTKFNMAKGGEGDKERRRVRT